MISRKSTCMITALGVCLGVAGGAFAADWTAYNDACFDPDKLGVGTDPNGQSVHYTSPNVTYWDIGSGHKHASSGELIKKSDGTGTGVTASLTQNTAVGGSVIWQPDVSSNWYGGYDPAAGTDARTTFGGIVDMTGVTYYGNSGWWVDLELTGLDSSKEYTFATSATRCKSSYNRLSIFTLTGADAYTNASTPGTDNDTQTFSNGTAILGPNQVRFNTGDNYNEGYVARWTGIDPGSDGTITICVEADPASDDNGRKAYSFDVYKLVQIPEPATMSLLGLGALALIRRRRKA